MVASVTATATATPSVVVPEQHIVTGFTTIFGVTVNPSVIGLATVVITLLYFLWQGQRESGANTFDVWDLVMDTFPDGSRRASPIKLCFMGAFVVSNYVLIDQEIKLSQQLPTVFGIYMATWGAALIAKVVYDQKTMPDFKIPGKDK